MSTTRTLSVLSGTFLLLHALPRLTGAPLWGVDFLTYAPPAARLVPLVGLALLLRPVQDALVSLVSSCPSGLSPWRSRRALAGWAAGGAAATLLLGIALRSRLHLLGDGALHLLLIGETAKGDLPTNINAQLTYRALGLTARLFPDVGRERIAQAASWTAGVGYWLVALLAARSLGRRAAERTVLLVFLLTPGFVAVFFGYVETYSVLFTAILAYLWTGAEAARGRVPWGVPAVLLGLLVALYTLNIVFLPAWWVFAVWRIGRGSGMRGAVRGAAACVLPVAVGWGLLAASGFSVAAYVEARTSSPLLPLLAAPGFTQAYRTLSWRHGVDVLNQYLLAAPAALLALPALRLRPFLRDADAVFLLGSAAVPVLFTLVANPEIGPFRDWDLMSIGALPLTLAVGVGFARRGGPGPLRDAAVLCGAAALHTAGWVAVNAAPGPSAARFHGLLETAALSSHAKAYGWETWANHERAAGQPEAALVAYESALRADPTNHRYWVYRGTVQFDLGRPERALAAFARAKELEPDYMPTWLNEGLALFKTGAWEKATKSLEHALELQPGLDEAEFILAHCYRKLGRRTEAAEHLERLLARTPDAVEPLFLLGNIYSEIDDVPRATACYRRMVELAPRDHRGHYNLGVCYMNQGRESQARAQFAEVLRLAPGSAEAATIRARLGGTTSP